MCYGNRYIHLFLWNNYSGPPTKGLDFLLDFIPNLLVWCSSDLIIISGKYVPFFQEIRIKITIWNNMK